MSEKLNQGFGGLPESKVEKEPTLSLEELDKLFRDRPELIEEIKKVFSVSLRRSFAADYEGQLLGAFAAPRDIQFHGAYIGIPLKEKRMPLSEAAESGEFADIAIDRALRMAQSRH